MVSRRQKSLISSQFPGPCLTKGYTSGLGTAESQPATSYPGHLSRFFNLDHDSRLPPSSFPPFSCGGQGNRTRGLSSPHRRCLLICRTRILDTRFQQSVVRLAESARSSLGFVHHTLSLVTPSPGVPLAPSPVQFRAIIKVVAHAHRVERSRVYTPALINSSVLVARLTSHVGGKSWSAMGWIRGLAKRIPSSPTLPTLKDFKGEKGRGLAFFNRRIRLKGNSSISIPLGFVLLFPCMVVLLILIIVVRHPASPGRILMPAGAPPSIR